MYKKDDMPQNAPANNLMSYMFINLHIEDVYMLDFYEVIADALYKYQKNATMNSHERWFTPHLEGNQNIQAVTTRS